MENQYSHEYKHVMTPQLTSRKKLKHDRRMSNQKVDRSKREENREPTHNILNTGIKNLVK